MPQTIPQQYTIDENDPFYVPESVDIEGVVIPDDEMENLTENVVFNNVPYLGEDDDDGSYIATQEETIRMKMARTLYKMNVKMFGNDTYNDTVSKFVNFWNQQADNGDVAEHIVYIRKTITDRPNRFSTAEKVGNLFRTMFNINNVKPEHLELIYSLPESVPNAADYEGILDNTNDLEFTQDEVGEAMVRFDNLKTNILKRKRTRGGEESELDDFSSEDDGGVAVGNGIKDDPYIRRLLMLGRKKSY